MADGLNDARALRVAEIINDYRTLLVHISQQDIPVPAEDIHEPGYEVIRESLTAAQALMSSNYTPVPPTGRNDAETEKAELRRVILDGCARRFQAHKIYLRAAAGRRWSINRANVLRGQRPNQTHTAGLKLVNDTFRQEEMPLFHKTKKFPHPPLIGTCFYYDAVDGYDIPTNDC
ncbi:unnamed protein product [Aspergillus oryzae RIB40]|uniref:DNA, SC003 n=1 Tax=Aspergillus oryzae (strain ATCC 42149 / RIB 40) TaxID=510516 RepID=Q2UKT6_ASPOR|nr:unnamed protein product [Aspergillus oryzae RIB40]BAE57829.1 unnamed protein product [Aspergillus oryzae RIB40]